MHAVLSCHNGLRRASGVENRFADIIGNRTEFGDAGGKEDRAPRPRSSRLEWLSTFPRSSGYPLTPDEAFLASDFDSFIPHHLVIAARKREHKGSGPLIIDVDPARFGADSTAIAWRCGSGIEKVDKRHGLDTMQVDRGFARHARDLIRDLTDWLDQIDPYASTELEEQCEDEGGQCEDEGGEHDGREPDVDDEPSLCSVTVTRGDGGRDLEADLGSLDRQMDQRRALAAPSIWCATDGECA
ncbi:hypothetical protein [Bradyrhizobium liaoningense]|uniref:hypothetical protein n=1 Tax=Bradyrhizobium liaoningense TaxID=43992 RepID=UPI001BAD203F|nr:hypothetical protein [Bradyrhizobium liaoningense]MBR0901340.1 hypothetical protein [Bradyrhizobium liaoningense]